MQCYLPGVVLHLIAFHEQQQNETNKTIPNCVGCRESDKNHICFMLLLLMGEWGRREISSKSRYHACIPSRGTKMWINFPIQ